MAWTTPGTATAGEVLTAAFWNTQVRDNLRAIRDAQINVKTVSTGALKTTLTNSTAAGGEFEVTGLSATITPSSSTSKILVIGTITTDQEAQFRAVMRLKRDSTLIAIGDAAGTRGRVTSIGNASGAGVGGATLPFCFLDEPGSATAITYKVFIYNAETSTRILYVNRGTGDGDNVANVRSVSTITVMEIAV